MKRVISLISAALLLQFAAFAQEDLNPTVTVTNTYQGEAYGIVKPAQLIQIPDSVSRFNLDFDYSVFESPYKSAYEFQPYDVQIRPQSQELTDGKLFVRAGAGYTLHPDFHAVFIPLSKPGGSISIFADHDSYFGNYWNYKKIGTGDVVVMKDPDNRTNQAGHYGFTDIGIRGRKAWGNGEFTSALAWNNIFSGNDMNLGRGANYGSLDANIRSFDPMASFKYDIDLDVRIGVDANSSGKMSVTDARLNGDLGVLFLGAHRVSLGVKAEGQYLGQNDDAFSGVFGIIPRDEIRLGEWNMSLGLGILALVSKDVPLPSIPSYPTMFNKKGQWIYPQVLVFRSFAHDRFFIEAGLTSGVKYQSYWDLVEENPYYIPWLDNTVEKMNLFAGTRGSLSDNLQFSIKGGFRMVDNDLLWKVRTDSSGNLELFPGYGYGDYSQLYATMGFDLVKEPFSASLDMTAGKTWLKGDTELFAPAAFEGKFNAGYHWGERVRAGMNLSWKTGREAFLAGNMVSIPGYADLGLFGEFYWRRNLAFFLDCSNLLNQTVMIAPFVAERGVSCTAGVIFKM